MKLFTVRNGNSTPGIEIEIKNLGFAKIPIINLGREEITISPPYPTDAKLYFGHIFVFGGKLYIVDLKSDLGFEEFIVFAENRGGPISSNKPAIVEGEKGQIFTFSLGEKFMQKGETFRHNGSQIVKE
jgi:hypothetical protein